MTQSQNGAQYPLHHVTYSGTKFEVGMSNGVMVNEEMHLQIIHHLTLDSPRGQGHMKCLLHVTLSGKKFEVATSNGLGGDAFTRKYIFWPLTLT